MNHGTLYTYILRAAVLNGAAFALVVLLLAGILQAFSWLYIGIAFLAGAAVAGIDAARMVREESQVIVGALADNLAKELVGYYASQGVPANYDAAAIRDRALRAAREQVRDTEFYCLDPDQELTP